MLYIEKINKFFKVAINGQVSVSPTGEGKIGFRRIKNQSKNESQ